MTGGYLNKIYDVYYLTGGQKFLGRYNPMGPNHGPGFVQEYTDAIRKFTIADDGVAIVVNHLPEIKDPVNLHRRDYNVAPQIMPNGEEGATAFSGVFQPTANLPFLNCVNIDSAGYTVNNDFTQYYNHYHCAHVPLYSVSANEMHTLFFGGIAQYYDNSGILVQDNDVPFVRTIARVTRDANGVMAEYRLPVEMPALLGAGSEFIPLEGLPQYDNGVLKLDDFMADTTLIGYVYGGINSTAPNIFFTNNGTQSSASSQIYKVYIIRNETIGTHEINAQSVGTLKMRVYPNPNNGEFVVKFNLREQGDVRISLYTADGVRIDEAIMPNLAKGENTYRRKIQNSEKRGAYLLTVETPFEKATQKIIIEP